MGVYSANAESKPRPYAKRKKSSSMGGSMGRRGLLEYQCDITKLRARCRMFVSLIFQTDTNKLNLGTLKFRVAFKIIIHNRVTLQNGARKVF